MKYQSRPVEIEAMRWCTFGEHGTECERDANLIVAWVNANGGEANYIAAGPVARATGQRPLIGVLTAGGWHYVAPGDYVVLRDHAWSVCNSETFERRWEPVR